MRKKTEGLTFPRDPLATMRELQELDAGTGAAAEEDAGSTVVQATGSAADGVNGAANLPAAIEQDTTGSATSSTVVQTTGSAIVQTTAPPADPLRQAVLTLLAQPLPGDPAKGPWTVTSIKVHAEIWERLGHVATMTRRNKQDLVAEALLDLFEKVRKGEG